MFCKNCGRSFHYCSNCFEIWHDNEFCSNDCMVNSNEIKSVKENLNDLLDTLSEYQLSLFYKFSDVYYHYERICDDIIKTKRKEN